MPGVSGKLNMTFPVTPGTLVTPDFFILLTEPG